jgi:peptide-methionine (R)-S-oxide reductase
MKEFYGYPIYKRDALPRFDLEEVSEEEWRRRLSPEQYKILRKSHTEPPGSGEYYHNKREGTYYCAAGGAPLFSSSDKFDSGSGWPSFTQPISKDAVVLVDDRSHGMHRIEVLDANSGSHLGHVFPDGPPPTGLRFCINSLALIFAEAGKEPEIP